MLYGPYTAKVKGFFLASAQVEQLQRSEEVVATTLEFGDFRGSRGGTVSEHWRFADTFNGKQG